MRKLSVALTATILVALPTAIIAQVCDPIPETEFCIHKTPKIDNRWPGYGGSVSCEAPTADSVQYDLYLWKRNKYKYDCTRRPVPCASIEFSDPAAYLLFCS